eukprot:m.344156 g.344156  ORF g.344156 m.344156 type:complete len:509 (-) comp23899_c0_seq1:13-1539(-)
MFAVVLGIVGSVFAVNNAGNLGCGNEGGSAPPPCMVPPWPATWQMNASTIIMPCNYTGYQAPSTTAGWGIVDFDWSNDLDGWSAAVPMNNDERQLVQVKMTKGSPLTANYTKVWIYRNSVYGYPWFGSVRKLLDDPDYKPWFLMFANSTGPFTSPRCDNNYVPPKCTDYFHTQMDTPRPDHGGYGQCYPTKPNTGCDCGTKPCGFYVFNHSSTAIINNQSFQDWFIDSYMLNEIGGSSLVDGFYWDDTWYPGGVGDDPEKGMVEDMGLTKSDLLQLTASYQANMLALRNRTLKAGKFAWQLMTGEHVSVSEPTACKADLRKYCQAGASPQSEAMYMQITGPPGPAPGPPPPYTNCSVFNCTCKGAADYYGINHNFGCAPPGAQNWWIHEAKPCASPTSCCTVDDYTKKLPPYPGCRYKNGTSLLSDLAAFLLIRGDYAWLGHGWHGCSQPPASEGGGYPFPPLLNDDYGTPLGLCAETSSDSGVFKREYTKSTVQVDCNSGNPSIIKK